MSGRDAMELVAESDRTLESQGVWVRQQTKAREQRRQRANHMLEASLPSLRMTTSCSLTHAAASCEAM